MNKPSLDTRPVRTDLTDRELCRLLSGFLGSAFAISEPGALRNAVRWIADTDEFWENCERMAHEAEKHGLNPAPNNRPRS